MQARNGACHRKGLPSCLCIAPSRACCFCLLRPWPIYPISNLSEFLDQQRNWLLIRYASRKGPLERWVSLDEAYGQTRP